MAMQDVITKFLMIMCCAYMTILLQCVVANALLVNLLCNLENLPAYVEKIS